MGYNSDSDGFKTTEEKTEESVLERFSYNGVAYTVHQRRVVKVMVKTGISKDEAESGADQNNYSSVTGKSWLIACGAGRDAVFHDVDDCRGTVRTARASQISGSNLHELSVTEETLQVKMNDESWS